MRPRIKRSSTRDGHDQAPRRPFNDRPAGEERRHPGRPGRGNNGSRNFNSHKENPDRRHGEGFRSRSEGFKNRSEGFRNRDEGFRGEGFRSRGEGRRDDRRKFSPKEKSAPYRTRSSAPAAAAQPHMQKEDDGLIRLNKFIANSGVCSRREADEYIAAGLVSVNGEIVTGMGVKVKSGDDVRFNGERLHGEKKVYVLLNKPKDYVTTLSDPHAEKNVMQLISRTLCPERIFPVGRLDKSTTGVLLLTNDGEIAERLTHPSYQKKKIYQVTLDKNVKQQDMDRLVDGVSLDDGPAYADEVAYNGDTRDVVGIEIHSGRNRIVRRMFEALGYKVRKLDRVYFAGLTKKGLKRGQWRFLSDEEVNILKNNFYE